MPSPTQLSLKALRDRGYTVQVVEHYNYFSHKRKDLFEIVDILGIKKGKTLGVQTTTLSNKSNHLKKINSSEYLVIIKSAGWKVELHSWRKLVIGKFKNGNPKRGWVNDIVKL